MHWLIEGKVMHEKKGSLLQLYTSLFTTHDTLFGAHNCHHTQCPILNLFSLISQLPKPSDTQRMSHFFPMLLICNTKEHYFTAHATWKNIADLVSCYNVVMKEQPCRSFSNCYIFLMNCGNGCHADLHCQHSTLETSCILSCKEVKCRCLSIGVGYCHVNSLYFCGYNITNSKSCGWLGLLHI